MKEKIFNRIIVTCICSVFFSLGVSTAMAGSEVGGKVTNNVTQASGIAMSQNDGDAIQGSIVLKNSEVNGDVTNNIDQASGIAMSNGDGDAVQASIVLK